MPQKPFWQRFTRRIAADLLVPCVDTRPTNRELDLAALEPRLLFSAGPIPIDGDAAIDISASDAGEFVFPVELPPVDSTQWSINSSQLVGEPGDQVTSLDTTEPWTVNEGEVATIDDTLFSAGEVDARSDQLTFTITGSSANGTFRVSGTPTTTFTQQEIDLGQVTYEQTGGESAVDHIDFELDDGQGAVISATFEINVAAINDAPVLNDAVISLDPVAENAGAPVGTVGTLISDLVDLTPSSKSVVRTDVIPFYSAGSGNNAQRSITWWWAGWDDWATKVEISLEKHGAFWQHLPYGRIVPGPMDFDGRSDAAAGVPGSHGPLPHIAEGLEHYLEQIVTPDDELYFYFGAPDLIYTSGMTYAEYEQAVLVELSDVLGLADDAKVSIGFDATYGQPTSLGGIWTVLGGPTGYNAQLLQTVASFGVNIILEPWIYQGATWAYDYDTIYTETFYRSQELDVGAIPRSSHRWASSEELTGEQYRLPRQSDVDLYYGGDWDNAIAQILAVDDIPLGRLTDSTSLFEPAWVEFEDELIDPATLVPLPGYNPPGTSSLNELALVSDVDFATLFSHVADFDALEGDTVDLGRVLAPASVLDNVFDADSLLTGVAITSADTANGTWWYSTDGGQSWDGLGAVSANSARLLAANSLTRIYFQPDASYVATATNGFTFQAWDRSDGIDNGTAGVDASSGGGTSAFSVASDFVAVSVTSVNDAPTINPIADQVATEDVVLGPIPVTVGDVDTPVTNLSVSATSSDPTIIPNGNISISGSGANRALTITPAPNQHGGPITITVTVSDGDLEAVEPFDIVVNPQQDAPLANDDFFVVRQDQTLNVLGPGPLSNDSDLDGDPLTLVMVSGPTKGTLLTQSDGSFQYTPAAGYSGDDSFQYVAYDGLATSNIATVRVSVRPELAPLPPQDDAPPESNSPSKDRPPRNLSPDNPKREDSPARINSPAIQFPETRLPARLRSAAVSIGALPPSVGIQVPSSRLPVPNMPIVPAALPAENPLPLDGDEVPDQPSIEVVDSNREELQSRFKVQAEDRQHELDELHQIVANAEAVEQLADGVAVGLGSALTVGYLLSLARDDSPQSKR